MPLGACCFLQLGLWIAGETSQGSHGLGTKSHQYEVKNNRSQTITKQLAGRVGTQHTSCPTVTESALDGGTQRVRDWPLAYG